MNRFLAALSLVSLLTAGCQQKMAGQPHYRPLEPSGFFANDMSARPLVAGTVARGHLRVDSHLYTGRRSPIGQEGAVAAGVLAAGAPLPLGMLPLAATEYADFVDTFPFPITRDILVHGQNRYMIYCVVCHDTLGTGKGKIVERGYTPPPSYHINRLRQAPVGHLFAVITQGYGSMPAYGPQIDPRDRWAIVAYIRALQLSQHFPADQAPADLRVDRAADERAGGKTP